MIKILSIFSQTASRPVSNILVLSVLFGITYPSFAATATAEELLYIEYLTNKGIGAVCNERIPDFSDKFEPRFVAWQEKWSDQLKRGASIAEKTKKQQGVDYELVVARVAQNLKKANTTRLNKACSMILDGLKL